MSENEFYVRELGKASTSIGISMKSFSVDKAVKEEEF